jgi:hypothetical protein
MSLLERYVAGDCSAVWREVCGLGEVTDDAAAVARELMTRVGRNVDTVASRLEAAGWRFLHTPAHTPPDEEDAELIGAAEALVGPLPLALTACLSVVGEVCLAGTHPAWSRTAYLFGFSGDAVLADPLWLPPAGWLAEECEMWAEEGADGSFTLELAPDELHKANISGSTHDIELPTTDLDPVLVGVGHRPGITLVDYLRVSLLRWGGFPGFEFEDDVPALVGELAAGLEEF